MNAAGHGEQESTTPTITQLAHAAPDASVYTAPPGKLSTYPLLRYAGYIGRVGLLAAALGAGVAIAGSAGHASAAPASSDSTSSSSESKDGGSTPHAGPAPRAHRGLHSNMAPRNNTANGHRGTTPRAVLAAQTNTTPQTDTTDDSAEPDSTSAPASSGTAPDVSGGPSDGTVASRQAADPSPGNSNSLTNSFSVTVDDSQGVKATSPVSVAASPKFTESATNLVVSGSATTSDVRVSVNNGPVTTASATSLTAAAPSVQAAASTTVVPNVVIEAESMTVSPVKAGSSYADSTASGRKALVLNSNGTASTTVTLPEATGLVIRAKGDQYKGAPSMTVSVDGKAVSTVAVSATGWTDYTVPIATAAGTHTVSIAFTNDLRASASKDRNLRVDKVTVLAAAVLTQTPAYFPTADWLWKPIASNSTIASNSATWVSYLSAPGEQHLADLYDYGVTLVPASAVTASTPRYDVSMSQPWGSDPFGSATVPIPKGTVPPPGSDGQIAVMDPITGQAYGIWQAKYNSNTNTWSGSWGGMTPISGNGIDTSGSATAAGIARYAGVVTAAELSTAIASNTAVNHALVFSTDLAGPSFVGPAIKSDGTNIAGVATPIPEGYRIRLDPSINVDAIPGITLGEKVIAKTLQTYGAYVVDQGSARMAFAFEAVPGATSTNPGSVYTSAGLSWDYYDMAHIPWSSLVVLAP